MPRGSRSRHGSNVEGGVHPHSGASDGTVIVAEFAWLPATCWCDSYVIGVPQREIRDLKTRSCGQLACVGPDGQSEPGLVVTKSGNIVDRVATFTRAKYTGAAAGPGPGGLINQHDHSARSRAYVAPDTLRRLHNDTETGERLYERRNIVLYMWADEQKSPREIARYLGVPYQTAVNDIHWLRKKRLI